MSIVHLIEGPVGAGKSTFAAQLTARNNGVHIALDEWFSALFSPDRPASDFIPWYIERKERLINLIWDHSQRIMASGKDAVLELGLVQRQARVEFCHRVQDQGHSLVIHVLDAPHEVRRERVQRRNIERGATFAMVVPEHVFEIANNLWEMPDEMECSEFEIVFVASALAGSC